MSFSGNGIHQVLYSVVEVNDNLLTMVMMDPTGRRVLALRYDGVALRELTVPANWSPLYSTYLVSAVFLHRASPGNWLQGSGEWRVISEGSTKFLNRGDKDVISLEYTRQGDKAAQSRIVRVPGSGYRIEVTTVHRRTL